MLLVNTVPLSQNTVTCVGLTDPYCNSCLTEMLSKTEASVEASGCIEGDVFKKCQSHPAPLKAFSVLLH